MQQNIVSSIIDIIIKIIMTEQKGPWLIMYSPIIQSQTNSASFLIQYHWLYVIYELWQKIIPAFS